MDLFLQKYDLTTRTLEWSTITGGSEYDSPTALALITAEDGTKTLVVGGWTWSGTMGSSSIPVQSDPRFYWQEEHADAAATDATHDDGFVYVFDEEQQRVLGTYFGGWGNDLVAGVGGYSSRLYLTGTALSTDDFPFNCPPTPDPYCDLHHLPTRGPSKEHYQGQVFIQGHCPVGSPGYAPGYAPQSTVGNALGSNRGILDLLHNSTIPSPWERGQG